MITIEDNELGDLFFEKRPDLLGIAVPAVIGIGAFLFGLFLFLVWLMKQDADPNKRLESMAIGGVICLVGVLFVGIAYAQWKTVARIHQHGVSKVTLWGGDEILYKDLDFLSFSQTKQYLQGIYVGTQYYFQLGAGKKTLYLNITLKKDADDQLADVRTLATLNVATKISKQLDAEGEAPWTNRLRFVRDGFEYLQQSQWHHFPFARVGNSFMHEENFYLCEQGSETPFLQVKSDSPNFFPGLQVLHEKVIPYRSHED